MAPYLVEGEHLTWSRASTRIQLTAKMMRGELPEQRRMLVNVDAQHHVREPGGRSPVRGALPGAAGADWAAGVGLVHRREQHQRTYFDASRCHANDGSLID